MATVLGWSVVRGDTWSRTFTLRDENNEVPAGLATATITMTVRNGYDASVLTASTSGGTISANGTTGEVTVSVPHATTDPIATGQYAYDLQVLTAGGVKTTPVRGSFTVQNDQTRT